MTYEALVSYVSERNVYQVYFYKGGLLRYTGYFDDLNALSLAIADWTKDHQNGYGQSV